MSFEDLCSGSLRSLPKACERMKSHIVLDENGSLVPFTVDPKVVISSDFTHPELFPCELYQAINLVEDVEARILCILSCLSATT